MEPMKGIRRGIPRQMLYHYRPEFMNKDAKIQSIDLGCSLVCKNETGIMGARHVSI